MAIEAIAVPLVMAFSTAVDYGRLPELNPAIVSSRRLRLCVAFFCKTIP